MIAALGEPMPMLIMVRPSALVTACIGRVSPVTSASNRPAKVSR